MEAVLPGWESWSVQDDLLLLHCVESGASLAALAAGAVTFSRPFSEAELGARWSALLYDRAASSAAVARWQGVALQPQPPPQPGGEVRELLAAARAARRAAGAEGVPADEAEATFSEVRMPTTAAPRRASPAPQLDEALLRLTPAEALRAPPGLGAEARAEARRARRRDRALLLALERGTRAAADRRLRGALAELRGSAARFALRKPEALVGRGTEEQRVDVDLSREGNASKVSRQHAFLQLRRDGRWYVRNVGRRQLLVDGAAVETGERALLPPACLLEIGGLRLTFRQNARASKTGAAATPRVPAAAAATPR